MKRTKQEEQHEDFAVRAVLWIQEILATYQTPTKDEQDEEYEKLLTAPLDLDG